MDSDKGIIFVIVTFIAVAGFGYLAWQSYNIRLSLKQMAAEQDDASQKVAELAAQLEAQQTQERPRVQLPEIQEWLKAIEEPLAAKAAELMGKAETAALEASVQGLSEKLAEQNKKPWQDLFQALAKDRQAAEDRYQQDQKRWQELIGTLEAEKERAAENYKNQEKRWSELLPAFHSHEKASQEQGAQLLQMFQSHEEASQKQWSELLEAFHAYEEASRKQYREVVQQLTEERSRALARAKELEEERKREIGRLLDQANEISEERKRQLTEFCAKRPESVICRDL